MTGSGLENVMISLYDDPAVIFANNVVAFYEGAEQAMMELANDPSFPTSVVNDVMESVEERVGGYSLYTACKEFLFLVSQQWE